MKNIGVELKCVTRTKDGNIFCNEFKRKRSEDKNTFSAFKHFGISKVPAS